MPTLVLLRHGKSAYPEGVTDHDRPLSGRGRRDAARAGELLAELAGGRTGERVGGRAGEGGSFDVTLVSGAVRAQQTWQQVSASLAVGDAPGPHVTGSDVTVDDGLYLASSEELIAVVRGLPQRAQLALVVGHNNGLEECASTLSGEPVVLKTATYAVLSSGEPWRLWRPGCAHADAVVVARG